jgi:dGTPase
MNEDLTEAIALAHDLGHTPFGHAGQDALNSCMRDYGGFEHNLQSLRIVDLLEEKLCRLRGLNLTFETREGILKHCSKANARRTGRARASAFWTAAAEPGGATRQPADEIAYNNHDVDDGLRAGLNCVYPVLPPTRAGLHPCEYICRLRRPLTSRRGSIT